MSRRRRGLAGPTSAGVYGAPGGDPRAVPTAADAGSTGRRWFRIGIRGGRRTGAVAAIPVDSMELPPAYVVIAAAFDPAKADSEVVRHLTAQGWPLDAPLLLRHHVRVPDTHAADSVAERAMGDGYVAVLEDPALPAEHRSDSALTNQGSLPVRVRLSRPQYPTVLSLAQERSRIAGLAARHGGDVEGYDLVVASAWRAGPG